MNKYALVHWTNSNSTTIVQCSLIDSELVSNPVKIGKIPSAVLGKKEPAAGWSKHDGRVICTHDKLSFLKQKENDFVHENSEEEHTEVGRGHRQRIRKVLPGELVSDDEDESSSQTQKVKSKKVMQAKTKRNRDESIIEKLKKKANVQETSYDARCMNCANMEEELQRLKAENTALQIGLPSIVSKMNRLVDSLSSSSKTKPASPSPSSQMTSTSSNALPVEMPVPGPSGEIELGHGVAISSVTYRNCNKDSFKRLTRDLMSALFTLEQMGKCSVFGKRGRGETESVRESLPRDKVMAIIDFVRKQFPTIASPQISQTMAYKLKDVRAATK